MKVAGAILTTSVKKHRCIYKNVCADTRFSTAGVDTQLSANDFTDIYNLTHRPFTIKVKVVP